MFIARRWTFTNSSGSLETPASPRLSALDSLEIPAILDRDGPRAVLGRDGGLKMRCPTSPVSAQNPASGVPNAHERAFPLLSPNPSLPDAIKFPIIIPLNIFIAIPYEEPVPNA